MRECLESSDDPREIFFAARRSTTSATRATCCGRSGSARRGRRLRLARGRPGARPRHRGHVRAGRSICTRRSTGRTCYIKIPATVAGLPAIEECIAARHVDQRHADLLARALPGRRRGVPARPRAARRRRAAIRRRSRSVASFFVSRLDTEADRRLEELGNEELQGKLGDREREARLQALPGGFRGPRLGARSQARARRSSGRCGPPPRPRTRPTGT